MTMADVRTARRMAWFGIITLVVWGVLGWGALALIIVNIKSPQVIEACPTPKPVRGKD